MKINSTLALFGFLGGLIFSILSSVRYFVVYPDLDKALVYVIVGLLICGVSWNHNQIVKNSDMITQVDDYLADKELDKHLNFN